MTKYIYDKTTGQVVEKSEKKSEVLELLPQPNPPPNWFQKIYQDYLDEVKRGGPR